MSRELLLDLSFLTEEERDIINNVISKDVEVRKQEQSRISTLREQLDELKENGLPEEEIETKNDRYCARCQTYFGIILNRGSLCLRCNLKVCKVCRENVPEDGWMCTLCAKVREVKAQSGAWFFQSHKTKEGNLFGSILVRKSLRRLPNSPKEKRQDNHQPVLNTDHDDNDNEDYDEFQYINDEYMGKQDSLDEDPSKTANALHNLVNDDRQVTYSDSDEASRDDYYSAGTHDKSQSREDLEVPCNDEQESPSVEEPGNEYYKQSQNTTIEDNGDDTYKDSEDVNVEHDLNNLGRPDTTSAGDPEVSHAPDVVSSTHYGTPEPATAPEISEASPSEASLDSREDALFAFSQTFSNAPQPSGAHGERHSGSGDDGQRVHQDEGEHNMQITTPTIITPKEDNARRSTHSSIIEYEEDLDVSFSKYGSDLGNKKLKDQLSMGSRESIASYYSNAGGEVYGKYPVTGEIYFGMKYDAKAGEFHVQIHQAREITAVDEKNRVSDPYVKTYLLPDRTRGGKRKTKVKKNTINPVFDEILSYKISYDEILHRTLWLAVWNHDRFGHNDFLGEVLVPIDEYQQSGFSLEDPEPQWYHLNERQEENPDLSYNGEIVFALKYVPPSAVMTKKKKKKKKEEKGQLHINIIEASNLLAKDSNGFSDPFCKSYLLPDKSKKTKQKTAVVKKSLNPKWNYQYVYENINQEELMDRVLELTVWDFDRGSSNEFLGGLRLGLGAGLQEWDDANSEEQAAWNKMLNNPNHWNQVTLPLRDHMGNAK